MGKKTEFVLWITAIGILAYWSMVFAGLFPVEELVPGYSRWFLSFPLADAWIAATAGGAAWLGGRDRRLGAILAAAAGSGLVFLAPVCRVSGRAPQERRAFSASCRSSSL
jgi:hypothetical protein